MSKLIWLINFSINSSVTKLTLIQLALKTLMRWDIFKKNVPNLFKNFWLDEILNTLNFERQSSYTIRHVCRSWVPQRFLILARLLPILLRALSRMGICCRRFDCRERCYSSCCRACCTLDEGADGRARRPWVGSGSRQRLHLRGSRRTHPRSPRAATGPLG